MQNPKVVSELLQGHGKRLRELAAGLERRSAVLTAVQQALPEKLASQVVSAGLEQGRLTLGVTGAVWASRLRYVTGALRKDVGAALAADIVGVRIRIVGAQATAAGT